MHLENCHTEDIEYILNFSVFYFNLFFSFSSIMKYTEKSLSRIIFFMEESCKKKEKHLCFLCEVNIFPLLNFVLV